MILFEFFLLQLIVNVSYGFCVPLPYNSFSYFGAIPQNTRVLTPEQQRIAQSDWARRNTLYLANPFANNPRFAGIVFHYPPARIPLYTLKGFGTTRPTERTTSRTTTRGNGDGEDEETTTAAPDYGDGEEEEFRQ